MGIERTSLSQKLKQYKSDKTKQEKIMNELQTKYNELNTEKVKITKERDEILNKYKSDNTKYEETTNEIQTKYDGLLSDNTKLQQKYDELNKKLVQHSNDLKGKEVKNKSNE